MKTKLIVTCLLASVVLMSCSPNVPELNENNRELLLGKWLLVKETMTNGDGFGGVYTREGEDLWIQWYYEFTHKHVTRGAEGMIPFAADTHDYTLLQQKDGTWLLTIDELYNKPRNLEGGNSPITIHKLTTNSLEWEYESYGGDEGPVVYYQYLEKTAQ